MDAELKERVLECLRGLEIGESISADGIADEIGEKLSDVYDVLEDLENAKLVEMNPAYRKGSDPTYTLTTRGKHHAPLKAREDHEPEPAEEDQGVPEVRPSADRVCRFCKKEMEPNKVRRHEHMCGKNPDSLHNSKRLKATRDETVEVPDPIEYAEDMPVPTAIAVFEHEVDAEPEFPEFLEQLNAEDPDVPDEVPDYSPANNAADQDTLLAGFLERVRAQDALVLKGSPGMETALRLISFCQQMAGSGAQVSVDATVQIASGFHIHVDLCVPTRDSDE